MKASSFLAYLSKSEEILLYATTAGIAAIKPNAVVNKASAMAPGIAEALFTTAFGLIAAIPAYVAYNIITSDIERYAKKLENFLAEFSSILSREIDDNAIRAEMAGE